MNGLIDDSTVPGDAPHPVPAPIEFSGAIDGHVLDDVHHVFRRKAKRREAWLFVGGLALVGFGICAALFSDDDGDVLYVALKSLAIGLVFLWMGWALRRGWARFMLNQKISGRIHGAGIVVDQLGDRAGWNAFCSARLSSSAALLFVDEKEKLPKALGFHGLPLHRSFFDSEEKWQEVSQIIRERVRNVSLVPNA